MTLRISEAAKILKVHPQTLRRWDEEGVLVPQKRNRQRRYTTEQIHALVTDRAPLMQRTNIIYCRVSSAKQSKDLERQIEFMERLFPNREVITDIASGVNFDRQGLNRLIERIVTNQVESVAISYKDRLARIGFDLIEQICRLFDCSIIVVNNIATSPEAELVEDLIAITTSFSARIHGLRKYSEKFSVKLGGN